MMPSASKPTTFMILDTLKLAITMFFSPPCNSFSTPFDLRNQFINNTALYL